MENIHYKNHLINQNSKVLEVLVLLDKLGQDAILFVVDIEKSIR